MNIQDFTSNYLNNIKNKTAEEAQQAQAAAEQYTQNYMQNSDEELQNTEPTPEEQAQQQTQEARAAFTGNAINDVSDILKGVVSSAKGLVEAGDKLAQTNPLALSGTPMQQGVTNAPAPEQTPEQQQAGEQYKTAAEQFTQQTVMPLSTVAMAGLGGAAAMGVKGAGTVAGILGNGMLAGYEISALQKGVEETPTNASPLEYAKNIAGEATGVKPLYEQVTAPDYAQQLYEKPLSTTVSTILNTLPVLGLGAAAYRGIRGGIDTLAERTSAENTHTYNVDMNREYDMRTNTLYDGKTGDIYTVDRNGETHLVSDKVIPTEEVKPTTNITTINDTTPDAYNGEWRGAPALLLDNGNDGYIALTKGNDVSAAKQSNKNVPAVIIKMPDNGDIANETKQSWGKLGNAKTDGQRAEALQELSDKGQVPQQAADLASFEATGTIKERDTNLQYSLNNGDIDIAMPKNTEAKITKQQIINDIKELTDIRSGNVVEGAKGQYDPYFDIIRSKKYADFDTEMHEIGHWLDHRFNLIGATDELVKAADDIWGKNPTYQEYDLAQKRAEGIAEFTRQYMFNPETAKKNFPTYFDSFERALKENPDINNKVQKIAEDLKVFYNQPLEAQNRGNIIFAGDKTKTTIQKIGDIAKKLYTDYVNRDFVYSQVDKEAEKILGRKLTADEKLEYAKSLANGASSGQAEALINQVGEDSKLVMQVLNKDFWPGAFIHDVTFSDIFKALDVDTLNKKYPYYLKNANCSSWEQAFASYLTARRQQELRRVNFESVVSDLNVARSGAESRLNAANARLKKAEFTLTANQEFNRNNIQAETTAHREAKAAQKIYDSVQKEYQKAQSDVASAEAKLKDKIAHLNDVEKIQGKVTTTKEKVMAKNWETIEDVTASNNVAIQNAKDDVIAAKKDLSAKHSNLDYYKQSVDRARNILSKAKSVQPGGMQYSDAQYAKDVQGTISDLRRQEKTLSNKMDSLQGKVDQLESIIPTEKTNVEDLTIKLKEAKAALKEAESNYIKSVRERVKWQTRNYKNPEDVKELNSATLEQKKAQQAYDSITARLNAKQRMGYATATTPETENATISNAPESFKIAAQKFYDYNDNMLNLMVKADLVTPEYADTLRKKYTDYASMSRYFDESDKDLISNPNAKISKQGSSRLINDPLGTAIINTYRTMSQVYRNEFRQAIVKLASNPKIGKYAEYIPNAKTGDMKENKFTVLYKGKKSVYQTTPEIYSALMRNDIGEVNEILRFSHAFSRAVQVGSTADPGFQLMNMLVDTISASIYSKHGFTPFVSTAKGLHTLVSSSIPDRIVKLQYQAGGVPMATFIGRARETANELAADLGKTKKGNVTTSALEKLRKAMELSESSTRIGALKEELNAGVPLTEALYDAKANTVDFSRMGAKMRGYNSITAFMNAGIQGVDRFARFMIDDPVRAISKGVTMLTIPTLAYWAVMHDSEDYKRANVYMRDRYWFMPGPGNSSIRLKKPFEPGLMFASLPERVLDALYEKNPDAMKQWASDFAAMALPNMIANIATPFLEWQTNQNMFTGADIVPQRLQNKKPSEQYTGYTSEFSKKVGKGLDLSPMKIDNLVHSTFSTLGSVGLQVSDALMGSNAPAKRWYELAGINRFFYDSTKNPKQKQDFYDMLKEAQMEYTPKDAQGRKVSKPADLKVMEDTAKQLSKLNKDSRDISLSDKYTPDEKRYKIDENNSKTYDILAKYFDKNPKK